MSNQDEPLLYEFNKGVVTITLNRPNKMNALNKELRAGLFGAFKRFEEDSTANVAILTGNGRAFCAGADLAEMADSKMTVPPRDFSPVLGRNVFVSKPVIAAVNGFALAGGFLLAQMCDLCVASQGAQFGITEVRRGRGGPWAVPLMWMIPQRIAMEVLLTGRPMSAQRAYEVGLINAVVEPSELISTATSLAEEIASNAPLSVRAAKRALYAATEMGRSAAIETADAIFEPVYLSEDAQEGPRAFKEGRAPIWTGR